MEGFLAANIDMSKVFDRVNWDFLRKLMGRMCIESKWSDRVLQSVSTVSYKIKVNDAIFETIWPESGLRQGDPLSPYLFILCQVWLSVNLRKLQAEKKVHDIKISRGALEISHLLFADDCIIFVKAELRQLENLKQLLWSYERLAG